MYKNFIFDLDVINLLILIMFLFSLLVFCSIRSYLLLTLMSLEFLVLVVFLSLINYLLFNHNEFYFILFFLTFTVCEGALGLSILVSMIRSHGNDSINSLNFLMWS